jgi:hypothetical protein
MKLLKVSLIVLLAVTAVSLKAQTADEIIDKNIAAMGGKDLLVSIKSMIIEGSVNAMGNEYPSTVTIVDGKGFKSMTTVNGMDIIRCITDTSAWMLNPMMGQNEPTAMPAEAIKAERPSLDVCGELLNYKQKGFTASTDGRETMGGVSAYKVKLTNGTQTFTYFLDPTTWYILRMDLKASFGGKDITNTSTYSNYKKTDFGNVMAFTMATTSMGYDITMNYTKIEVNKDVDAKIFATPK